MSNDVTRYDEDVETIMWTFIARQNDFISNQEFEAQIHGIMTSVEDPMMFTLTLVKWTQALLVHGAASEQLSVAQYLAAFMELMGKAQEDFT